MEVLHRRLNKIFYGRPKVIARKTHQGIRKQIRLGLRKSVPNRGNYALAVLFVSGDMQGCGVVCSAVRLDNNLDILIECHQKAQQTFDRKLPEFAAEHLGDIGLFDAQQLGSFRLREATLLHDAVNLGH
jgi:hypothetical protein